MYIIGEKVSNDDFTGVLNITMQQLEISNNANICHCGYQQEASIYDKTPLIWWKSTKYVKNIKQFHKYDPKIEVCNSGRPDVSNDGRRLSVDFSQ